MSITCNVTFEDLDLNEGCVPNMSGVKVMGWALKSDIQALPKIPDTRTSIKDYAEMSEGGVVLNLKDHSIQMKTGKRFFRFYTGDELGELKYAVSGPQGGKGFKANLEVFHPGLKSTLLGFMSSTMNRELVLLVKLNNGDIHVLGDLDRGVMPSDGVEITSGKAATDANGATLQYAWNTPTAQIYLGEYDSLFEVNDSGSGSASGT
jgi:hypothetical protein